MREHTPKTVPLRDLTPHQIRNLLGTRVTVDTYESAESEKPFATVTGTLALVAIGEDAIGLEFEHAREGMTLPSEYPVTLTTDAGWMV